jgi:tRNA threonylcarbamoyladenosine biosynthesis protein TsaE
MFECVVSGEQRQEALGRQLAKLVQPPCSIFLQGDLAAGKTTLARGFLRGLGYEGKVKSPTYTLLEPYELARVACYHFDLYRLAEPQELSFLGLDDLQREDAIWLVEWPEKGEGVLPEADLTICISHQGEARVLGFTPHSKKGRQIINNLQEVWSGD